jgi:NADH:ubiquinone oxidoreductase subunit 2 (subunit N)
LYYYARVIKFMYMEKGAEGKIRVSPMMGAAIAFAVVMVVLIGVFPDPFVSVCKDAAATFAGLLSGWP